MRTNVLAGHGLHHEILDEDGGAGFFAPAEEAEPVEIVPAARGVGDKHVKIGGDVPEGDGEKAAVLRLIVEGVGHVEPFVQGAGVAHVVEHYAARFLGVAHLQFQIDRFAAVHVGGGAQIVLAVFVVAAGDEPLEGDAVVVGVAGARLGPAFDVEGVVGFVIQLHGVISSHHHHGRIVGSPVAVFPGRIHRSDVLSHLEFVEVTFVIGVAFAFHAGLDEEREFGHGAAGAGRYGGVVVVVAHGGTVHAHVDSDGSASLYGLRDLLFPVQLDELLVRSDGHRAGLGALVYDAHGGGIAAQLYPAVAHHGELDVPNVAVHQFDFEVVDTYVHVSPAEEEEMWEAVLLLLCVDQNIQIVVGDVAEPQRKQLAVSWAGVQDVAYRHPGLGGAGIGGLETQPGALDVELAFPALMELQFSHAFVGVE